MSDKAKTTPNDVLSEDEVSNVDLQFMGTTNNKQERGALVEAESDAAAISDHPEEKGLDQQDVILTQTMDGSDAPSTNMGDCED